MFTTAASPDYVLHAGEVYDLPRSLAQKLLKTPMVHGVGADGKPKLGGPCCEVVSDPTVKAKRPPAHPDPEDKPDLAEDEEFEALTDEEDSEEEDAE
jgi:hypothetical protein